MDYVDGEVGHNKSEYSASFYIKLGNRIAISEMTFIDTELTKNYFELIKEESLDNYNQALRLLSEASGILFFNRLNVPVELRNKGYGKKLMKETINFCNENNYLLINTASNYGEMGQDNLIDFYKKAGMKLVNEEGLLIYHKNIENKQIKKKKI